MLAVLKGNPLVWNLNSTVEGLFEGAFQAVFN